MDKEFKCKFSMGKNCCQGIGFCHTDITGVSCDGGEYDRERCPLWN